MKIIKPATVALLYRTLRFEQRDLLSIGMLAMFPLESANIQALAAEADLWKFSEQALGKATVLDAALPKPRGEWFAYGAAYAPNRKAVPLLSTLVDIGGARKELYVFGDRHFNDFGGITQAVPFIRMPIDAAHAYGGPGVAANPSGIGAAPSASPSGASPQALPNIESPSALIAQANDVRLPAGYWAWPTAMPERSRLLGEFDRAWLANEWPHLPAGTQTDYFHCAAPDQRIDGFWRGDESVGFTNMHPNKPALTGQLPGLRARCFVNRRGNEGPRFEECAARAETIWLFPELGQGIVLYRAVAAIDDEDADDVLHIVADWEPMSTSPCPVQTYFDRLSTPVESTPPVQAVPEPELDKTPARVEAASGGLPAPVAPRVPDAMARELQALGAEIEAQVQALENRLGMSREQIEALVPVEAAPRSTTSTQDDVQALSRELDEMMAGLAKQSGMSLQELEKLGANALAQQAAKDSASEAADPMAVSRALGDNLTQLQAQAQQAVAQSGKSLDAFAASLLPDAEHAVAFKEAATLDIGKFVSELGSMNTLLAGMSTPALVAPESASPVDAARSETPATSAVPGRLTREEVIAYAASRRSMSGLDLSGLDLSNAPLDGADFSKALLSDTTFKGSRLSRANLSGCVLDHADFTDTDIRDASLANVTAHNAIFINSRLDASSLEAGNFTSGDFTDASIVASNCTRTIFTGSKMDGLRAAECAAPQAEFGKCSLKAADFGEARLTDAVFDEAQLGAATFAQANCERLRLFGTRATGACFDDANLSGSRAGLAAELNHASFVSTKLDGASWLGVDISHSVFDNSSLERANFDGVRAVGARLARVNAKSIRLAKADLSRADLSQSNFMNATFRRAKLDDAQLQYSNLYGAECYGSTIGKAALDGANVDRTIVTIPGRIESRTSTTLDHRAP